MRHPCVSSRVRAPLPRLDYAVVSVWGQVRIPLSRPVALVPEQIPDVHQRHPVHNQPARSGCRITFGGNLHTPDLLTAGYQTRSRKFPSSTGPPPGPRGYAPPSRRAPGRARRHPRSRRTALTASTGNLRGCPSGAVFLPGDEPYARTARSGHAAARLAQAGGGRQGPTPGPSSSGYGLPSAAHAANPVVCQAQTRHSISAARSAWLSPS